MHRKYKGFWGFCSWRFLPSDNVLPLRKCSFVQNQMQVTPKLLVPAKVCAWLLQLKSVYINHVPRELLWFPHEGHIGSRAVWMHDLFILQHFDVWYLGNPILCVYWHNTRCLSAVSETSLEALLDAKLQCDLGLGLLRNLQNWEKIFGNVHRLQWYKNRKF